MVLRQNKSYICRKLPKGVSIKIDGKLDEKIWTELHSVGQFEFPWGKPNGLRQSTVAKLCWDDEYLYLGYHANDISINSKKRGYKGTVWKDDVVEIFIDPTPKDSQYFGFELNANGDLLDYSCKHYRTFDYKWRAPGAKTAVKVTKGKYFQAEFRIPFRDLGVYPKDGSKWRMCLCRCDYNIGRHGEFTLWNINGNKRPDFHILPGFGTLVFKK